MCDQKAFEMLGGVPIQSFPVSKGARLQLAASLFDVFADRPFACFTGTQLAAQHAQVVIIPQCFGNSLRAAMQLFEPDIENAPQKFQLVQQILRLLAPFV
jgi:hypothetical protein